MLSFGARTVRIAPCYMTRNKFYLLTCLLANLLTAFRVSDAHSSMLPQIRYEADIMT